MKINHTFHTQDLLLKCFEAAGHKRSSLMGLLLQIHALKCCKQLKVREVQCQALPAPLPVDMKKGMRNLPLSTRARRFCRVLPSKGRAPHTSTYSTTPRLCPKQTQAEFRSISGQCLLLAPPHRQNTGAVARMQLWKRFFGKHFLLRQGFSPRRALEHSGSKAKQTEQKSDQSQRGRGSSHTQISTFGPSYSLPSKSSGAA